MAFTLIGCSVITEETEGTTSEGATGSTEEATGTAEKTEKAELPDDMTIEDIAELNGVDVEELNCLFDEDGYLTFLDGKYTDEIIEDEDDALLSIEHLYTLLGLDDISLVFYQMTESPATGCLYYCFYQTQNVDVNGTLAPAEYLQNTLVVMTDEDGTSAGISAYLCHDEIEDIDSSHFLEEEDVLTYLESMYLRDGAELDPEKIKLVYLSDASVGKNFNQGKIMLCYAVTTDAGALKEELGVTSEDDNCSSFYTFIVSAVKKDELVTDDNPNGIAVVSQQSSYTKEDTEYGLSTTEFFEDKTDAGEYTYTVNFDWMPESDKEYAVNYFGADEIEVTVPVMYSESEDLYYLGSAEEMITVSNYYDFQIGGHLLTKMNFYVASDPSELMNWHFAKSTSSTGKTYFDDPNYVLSSFATYVDTIHKFNDRYVSEMGFNEEPPMMLFVYYCMYFPYIDYPDDVTMFDANAANYGEVADWSGFVTSPNLGGCLDPVIMSHEYTHNVNQKLTSSLYLNEQAAVMEGYADIIGYSMAKINDEVPEGNEWKIGGVTCAEYRDLIEPLNHNHPKYYNGVNYVNPVPETGALVADAGGAHSNSLVVGHLGYLMTDDSETRAGEEALSDEENLDAWFECLFISTYDSDFADVGHYLNYAVKKLGYPDTELDFVSRLTEEYGFMDGNIEEEYLEEDCTYTLNTTLNWDDENYAEVPVGIYYYGNDASILTAGGFTDGEQTFRTSGDYPAYMMIQALDFVAGVCPVAYVELNEERDGTDFEINMRAVSLNVGDVFENPEGLTYESASNVIALGAVESDNGVDFTIANIGTHLVQFRDENGNIIVYYIAVTQ